MGIFAAWQFSCEVTALRGVLINGTPLRDLQSSHLPTQHFALI